MIRKSLLVGVVLVLVLSVVSVGTLAAQGVASRPYTSTITLQNPNSTTANVNVSFFDASGNEYLYSTTIDPYAAPVINLGTVSTSPTLGTEFAGSAVISSDQPVVAINLMRDSADPNGWDMGIYTAFSSDQIGGQSFIPSVSNNYSDQTSVIAVQNVDTGAVDITIHYYDRFTGNEDCTKTDTIPASASHMYDSSELVCDTGALTAPWNGTVMIESTGNIIAAVHQPYETQNKAVDFEGVASGGSLVYLPSAFQDYVGQTTNIAVQNVGLSTLSAVTVTYYSRAGAVVGYSRLENLEANRKLSTRPETATWWDSSVPVSGYLGSAVIESPEGPVVSVVNITSAAGTSTNIAAAFNGINGGCEYLAVPYVRWYAGTEVYRTYIAVQNVGSAATDIDVMYYDRSGNLVGTDSTTGLGVGVKWNTNVSTSSIPSADQDNWQGTVIIHATTPGAEIAGMIQAKRNDGMQASNFMAPCFTP